MRQRFKRGDGFTKWQTIGTSCLLLLGGLVLGNWSCAAAGSLPNIVYILTDDLGYGDVSCLNSQSKIPTPNIDRLAREGVRFTDAHSASAVCTPTRYGILTGRYCWRTRLQSGVLGGYSPPLIAPGRLTVATLLKQHGYATACIGKWHLGLDWALAEGEKPHDDIRSLANVDFTKPICGGPLDCGFDSFFGIAGSLDMPPYAYIENDHTVGLPTELTKEGGQRQGLTVPGFKAVNVMPDLTRRAVEYIGDRAADARAGKPFFLYFALTAPHTPIVPTDFVAGKSRAGRYGDFVTLVDWTVGEVLQSLHKNSLADNTLVIVTSDNGSSPAGFSEADVKKYKHQTSYIFRGRKSDAWDGGHRIPFLARWPGVVKPGSVCDQTICLNDLIATCAAIIGEKLPADDGEDSVNILPALRGRRLPQPLREATVHHSITGRFAIREGRWKLELCCGSGGWSHPTEQDCNAGALPPIQLYDMITDVAERTNVAQEHPDIVARLTKRLETYVANGRSTPGTSQHNDAAVNIHLPPHANAKSSEGD